MTSAPVVPRSLEEPVPRSDARNKVQRIIDADRREVEHVMAGSENELARILAQSEAELRQRLAQLRAAGMGDSWTAADVESSLVQVRAALGVIEPKLVGILAAQAAKARAMGDESVAHVLEHFERLTAGSVRPLAVRAAMALDRAPLLMRYQASVDRYGVDLIGKVKRELSAGVLTGQTFSDMARKLAGSEGKPGMLMQHRSRAELIVRTEGMAAYAQGAQDEIVAQKAKRFPTLKRRIIATFDSRTAQDSYRCHGQVRELNEPFNDGNHSYQLPPSRPRDREVVIPWRTEWEQDDPTEDWERERSPAQAAGMVAPQRPTATVLDD